METDDDNVLSWRGERTNSANPKSTAADHFFFNASSRPAGDQGFKSVWGPSLHRLSIVALPLKSHQVNQPLRSF